MVSLAGVDAPSLSRCAALADELDRRAVPLTLLIAPRHAGTPAEWVQWVRDRHRNGDDVLMHGFDHTPDPRSLTLSLGRRAEFATLPAHEAGLRLTAAMSAMERAALPVDGFAPPRWMASAGTVIALQRKGFRLCADLMSIRDLHTGIRVRARVHALAGSERTESWRGFALVRTAIRTARRGGTVRLAVDAVDLTRSTHRVALLDAVDAALDNAATPLTYRSTTIARAA
ncbi:hypothetical protein CLV40_10681 [Actinokineospora auranticolor]|uniref:Deacetylase n=1 Tax=Actinokineospora auranticolor TaxID=155976 RepID=A0A2S6GRU7_9PSEU|nr:hypothetical protein CLV40_10681 [Actinokineospora auranticolor]